MMAWSRAARSWLTPTPMSSRTPVARCSRTWQHNAHRATSTTVRLASSNVHFHTFYVTRHALRDSRGWSP
eukprot:3232956-Prorocentrum_lima.AAC.1